MYILFTRCLGLITNPKHLHNDDKQGGKSHQIEGINMKYIKIFLKETWGINININMKCIFLIVFSALSMTLFTGVLEYTKIQYSGVNQNASYLNLKLGSIQTVFKLAVIIFLIVGYYELMEKYANCYIKMKAKGISLKLIRSTILFQTLVHVLISFPIGIVVCNNLSRVSNKLIDGAFEIGHASGSIRLIQYPVEVSIIVIIVGIVLAYRINNRIKTFVDNERKTVSMDNILEFKFDN